MSLDIDKKKLQFTKQLRELEDAYCEIRQLFETCEHYAVRKSLSVALYEINEAIYNLKEAIK